jgi:hypothetical protein
MKKKLMAGLGASVAACALVAAAPGATAVTVNSGWGNAGCWSGASIFPIIVNNYSNQWMTGSYTLPSDMSTDIQFYPSQQDALWSYGCSPFGTDTAPASQGVQSGNFNVLPFQQEVMWVVVAPTNGASNFANYFSIGGQPGGAKGAGWYDFSPNLNGTTNFKNITSVYSGTGGTNGSNQYNFNIVNCVTNSNGTVTTGTNILSPYSGGQMSGPTYGSNAAMCFAWFPQGNMISNYTSTGAQGTTVQAAQLNNWSENGGNSLTNQNWSASGTNISFAGTATGTLNNVSYVITGTGTSIDGVSNSLGGGIGSGAGFVQSSATNAWAAVNLPLSGSNGILTLTVNGAAVASYTYGTPVAS